MVNTDGFLFMKLVAVDDNFDSSWHSWNQSLERVFADFGVVKKHPRSFSVLVKTAWKVGVEFDNLFSEVIFVILICSEEELYKFILTSCFKNLNSLIIKFVFKVHFILSLIFSI